MPNLYQAALATGKTPAIVLDTDDTMLMTYDREVAAMHFNFDPVQNNADVLNEVFPATPAMVAFENAAVAQGFHVIGITGRSAAQQAASIENVTKVGYTGFTTANYFTKWAPGAQPSYITCAAASCTTVEYKAGTRAYLETTAGGGYDIALNVGDQWSDLQGGSADHTVKLPNPTYYLPSPDLPGMSEPQLAPRTTFTMAADGSSGATQGGEGIPNIDSVKKTIATYYGDPGTGISNKVDSPYIREMKALALRQGAITAAACYLGKKLHQNPAVILDADDTNLWTYDMEVERHALQLRPGAAEPVGARPALPGDAVHGRPREGGSEGRMHGDRPDRAQRRPEGRDPRQPGQGRLHRDSPRRTTTRSGPASAPRSSPRTSTAPR